MMARYTVYALITLALAGVGAGSYWLGLQQAESREPAGATSRPAISKTTAPTILFYRNPMGLADTSPVPKKDSMGMDYIAVYADETASAGDKGRLVWYRNPMGLADTSPVPKKDSMGMDYIPVYESELGNNGHVRISTEKMQKLGVRTAPAEERDFRQTVNVVGRIELDESLETTIAPRFEGWIETLHVNTSGQAVSRGQLLFEAWSPEILAAEQEYQLAVRAVNSLSAASSEARAGVASLPQASLQRLRQLGVDEIEIHRLQNGGEPRRTVRYYAPASGVVMERMASRGARFMPGEALFRIADLSRVWLIAELPEQSMGLAVVGSTATLSLNTLPGTSLSGRVDFVYPTLNREARTARVRITLQNPGQKLKPGQFARAELVGIGTRRVGVPDSAVIDSGRRQLVFIAHGNGLFEPREVKTGARSDGYIAITEGVGSGEQVVVSANFLIDAESNLKAALGTMTQANSAVAAQPTSTIPSGELSASGVLTGKKAAGPVSPAARQHEHSHHEGH